MHTIALGLVKKTLYECVVPSISQYAPNAPPTATSGSRKATDQRIQATEAIKLINMQLPSSLQVNAFVIAKGKNSELTPAMLSMDLVTFSLLFMRPVFHSLVSRETSDLLEHLYKIVKFCFSFNISESSIDSIGKTIEDFRSLFVQLYPTKGSLALHMIYHIPKLTRMWGPLSCTASW